MNEQPPVPMNTRWLVWTDGDAQAHSYSSMHMARWFWSASGPRGHASGAENEAEEATRRAMLAAAQLESSQRPKNKAVA